MMRRTRLSVAIVALFGTLLVQALPAAAQHATHPNLNAQLLVAAREGNVAFAKQALANGAAPDSRNRFGDTPLIIAAKRGNTELARTMIDAGANVNQQSVTERATALMAASLGGHVDIVRMLLERKADANVADRVGKTAMVYASGSGHTRIVEMLLDYGVPVNARYDNDLTALMWAAGQGHDATAKLLLERGADASLRDNRGKSAADIARDLNQAKVTAVLGSRS